MSKAVMKRLNDHRMELEQMVRQASFGGPNLRVSINNPGALIKLLEDAENEIAKLRRHLFGDHDDTRPN